MNLKKRIDAHDRWFARSERIGARTDKTIADTWKLVKVAIKLGIEARKEQKEANRILKKKLKRTEFRREAHTFG